jgi:hypothetical protein
MRVDGAQLIAFEPPLRRKRGQRIEHFAFQALHQFERHVEKVAGAAGGIEDSRLAQLVVKRANYFFCAVRVAVGALALRRSPDADPFFPQGLDHGRDDQPFDIGAGCNARRACGAPQD